MKKQRKESKNGLRDRMDWRGIRGYEKSDWIPGNSLVLQKADEFEEITLSRLDTLVDLPLIGVISTANQAVRSILLTKHNKLYYQISGNLIIVLNIFDTRQNPSKNKFEREE